MTTSIPMKNKKEEDSMKYVEKKIYLPYMYVYKIKKVC